MTRTINKRQLLMTMERNNNRGLRVSRMEVHRVRGDGCLRVDQRVGKED